MVSLSRDDCNAEAEADVEVIVAVAAGSQMCRYWLCNVG
jgi:hypothetical protein